MLSSRQAREAAQQQYSSALAAERRMLKSAEAMLKFYSDPRAKRPEEARHWQAEIPARQQEIKMLLLRGQHAAALT